MQPFATLAHSVVSPEDLYKRSKSWMISRKYNGHCVIWDGGLTVGKPARDFPWYKLGKENNAFSTGMWSLGRDGKCKVIHAPHSFTKKLPKGIPLQGEVWKDDNLAFIKKVVKAPNSAMWDRVKFIVYNIKPYSTWEGLDFSDLPESFRGHWYNIPFQERYMDLVNSQNDQVVLPDHSVVEFKSVQEVSRYLNTSRKTATELKWEGTMWQNMFSNYECKRSYTLLKDKAKYDGEAIVLGYEDGKTGARIGKIGCIKAELTWDEKITSIHGGDKGMIGKTVTFHISGLNEEEQVSCSDMYPVFSEIKFTFSNVSGYGVPQSANIYREET